jgi:large subunit ribosomal protein L1
VHAAIGKASFDAQKLAENSEELIQTIVKLRPSSSKGTYIKSISISSTMGIGVSVSANTYQKN